MKDLREHDVRQESTPHPVWSIRSGLRASSLTRFGRILDHHLLRRQRRDKVRQIVVSQGAEDEVGLLFDGNVRLDDVRPRADRFAKANQAEQLRF